MKDAENRLRKAVAAARYDVVLELAAEYCRIVEDEVRQLDPHDERVRSLGKKALDLLAWAKLVTMTSRACCADRLQQLPKRVPYAQSPADRHWWVMEA
jgi:hypothetical protein